MQEFAFSAKALNQKLSDSVVADIDSALKAINFLEDTTKNDQKSEDLYMKVRHTTQDLYYNEKNFIL